MFNPKLQSCNYCGYGWMPRLYHKLVMLVRGRYVFICPKCHAVLVYRLIGHVVKVEHKPADKSIWRKG